MSSQPSPSAPNSFLAPLLQANAAWAARQEQAHPGLFARNGAGQSPQILWIGCSDSRAGDQCLDLPPGEVFVHRNIANLLPNNDVASLSVVQFAVDVLKVKHIVVCGHYDCGGAHACFGNKQLGGLLDTWLRNLRDIKVRHGNELDQIPDQVAKVNRLVELNVATQVHNLTRLPVVADAIARNQLDVTGVVYDVASGKLAQVDVPEDSAGHDYRLVSSATALE
ncbi:carbonic anhydrase [Lipomyces japonicus]|uniref:carbonic anhydrase n=1 Tax=Lipomyces japonicus TaxID=56871 RepID=UPI0034D017DF